ncbi:MAG: HD-GYP domain-containing protein [Propionivibrio sp.]|nr:HD-GYP domain-containing protein [Propionivibrio sp.]MBK8402389.1 HD-GYP domain-containing protein [Propionivibrio sp.]MBK8743543.1 HD-GYP domain-containing protein [Propionivibrio sp.]MBK8892847.1 HD-GYP domain-containing protein [Propionivibrio sp.]MBL0206491.1 HD-GYP domain-containing protein [Propionivibrio sp.]
MLKKISAKQLVVGMHLKEFCGSWMEHPFWRTAFVITDPKDIDSILASSIKEVWIDSSKGLDVVDGETAISEAESDVQVEAELKNAAQEQRKTAAVPASVEYARAAKICAQSKRAVASMFQEARMGKAVDTEGAQKLVEEISDSISRNPGALISLARLKTADDYTYMHSVAVCALMIALSKQLNLDEIQTRSAGVAGLLHDLGKALMPMDVLNKPGKLTDEEFAIIKTHPEEGHKLLLASTGADEMALDVVLHHHEKTDGSGYPKHLKDSEISLYAKMGAVCDVYDAITSNRPYKAGWDPAESLRKMAEWANGHFDPTVFQAFVKSLGIYPVGSLVKLNSGRLGIVIEQAEKSLLTPRIKVFYSTRSNTRIKPEIVDLSRPKCPEKIAGREDPAQWNFADLNELWSGQKGF